MITEGDTQFPSHQAYLCSLNDLYFLLHASSTHNLLKPEKIDSEETIILRKSSIFPSVCRYKTATVWASCTNEMSAFNCRPLRTSIHKFTHFIPLFSSHWTIRTIMRTWQSLLCWGATFRVWSLAIYLRLLTVHGSPTQYILSCTIYLAYLHIFVPRGWQSNTDIWFNWFFSCIQLFLHF